jgi:hypothetical protein
VFTRVVDGVEMHDRVEYEMPLGPLGRIAHWLVVRRQLAAIFDIRARAIGQRFGAPESAQRASTADAAGDFSVASQAVPASRAVDPSGEAKGS